MLGRTIRNQIKVYRKESYLSALGKEIAEDKQGKIARKFGMEIHRLSLEPEYIDFFTGYVENVKDIVFPKMLTKIYVSNQLKSRTGKTYNRTVKDVCVLNKDNLKSFGSRIIDNMSKNFKKW